jgi:hypothetical protein
MQIGSLKIAVVIKVTPLMAVLLVLRVTFTLLPNRPMPYH